MRSPSRRRVPSARGAGPPPALWVGAAAVVAGILLLLTRAGAPSGPAPREASAGGAGAALPAAASAAKPAAGAPETDRRWDEAKGKADRGAALLAEAEAARSGGDAATFQAKVRQAGELLEPACEAASALHDELEAAGRGESALGREILRALEAWNRKLLVIHKTRAARR